ncbi:MULTISPECIES: prepilin-type N-terminal cleavage/methylation domain-containing protein [unclassified Pseudomonas]|uniref:prepilin-type N-terminal cleavage/methylation domain-containing protein n=1 Tax=unclassified Pseudomonas TaxID=196821 RepID=UPI002449BD0C|nr:MULTISPECIES: prepilin-type N-terminal cleavage/methylation domain-containing protein [unclassified Pseudomonas]MDG9926766.1 prepilin-type N-terminal cleavage/methylation domain-containing protein [Pseudomonas sp. GD04042]MDH0482165.1 prepilin-type N-terminal cleavage/methylation domain-containing protein [Pseudomonas sp. GD04015]MDH0603600.1 prepilin-type N-terminal cleavage/methylation domain-containing protein [Pseudomonas sp. GD03869]
MKAARGFTLVEVLIALVLAGLLVVVLFGGFRAGIRSWQLAEQHTASVEEPRQLSALLYRHLGQLLPAEFPPDSSGRVAPAFVGEQERMRYVAPLSMSAGGIPYVFELSSDSSGVWVRFAPYEAGKAAEDLLASVEPQLVSSSLHLSFRYFGPAEEWDDSGSQWVDAFSRVGSVPQLVSVRVDGARKGWPELILPVSLMEPVGE